MLGTVGTHSINGALYAKMPYDMVKDFAPVTLLATTPNLLVVHNDVPAKTLAEFIALGKKEGKMTFASAGSGTSIHVSGELFKTMTGIDMTHIPYKGRATAIPDLLGGRVTMMFDNMPSSLPLVKEGKLRALGVTSAQRSAAAPDIPTIAEQGLPGFEAVSWFAMFAPGRHAQADRRQAAGPGEEDPAVARGRQAARRDRPRGRRLDARGAGRLPARRDREVGQGGEGLGREGGVMSGPRKVCVVTGSSSGIGAATARLYARNGWNVVVNCSREVGPAEAVSPRNASPPGPTRWWSRPTSRSTPIAAASLPRSRPGFGRADVLVNNAGTTKFVAAKDLDGLDAAEFHRVYGVNVIGAFQMARALMPMLQRQPGAAIVNVSSIASMMGFGSSLAYMASKGALNAMTIGMARAFGPAVRVNAIAPGLVETPVAAEGPRRRALRRRGAVLQGPLGARRGDDARGRGRRRLVAGRRRDQDHRRDPPARRRAPAHPGLSVRGRRRRMAADTVLRVSPGERGTQ